MPAIVPSPSATSSIILNLQQRCRRHNHLSYVCRASGGGTTRLMKLRTSSKCSSSCRYRGCAWCSKRTQRKRNNRDAKWRSLLRWVDSLSPAPASSLLPGSHSAAHLLLTAPPDNVLRLAKYSPHGYVSRTSSAAISPPNSTRSSNYTASFCSRDPSSSTSQPLPTPPRQFR